jgi:hypothetical protein
MRSFLLLLAGTLALVIYISWNLGTFERASDGMSGSNTTPSIGTAQQRETSEEATQKASKRTRTGVNSTGAVKGTRKRKLPSPANVKTDAAPVYAFNSLRSAIVYRLKKGDSVEADLELVDSEGRWTLIRTSGLNRSGFVRSEDLEWPDEEQFTGSHNEPNINPISGTAPE